MDRGAGLAMGRVDGVDPGNAASMRRQGMGGTITLLKMKKILLSLLQLKQTHGLQC